MRLANQAIADSIVLMVTCHNDYLADERMERIGDYRFVRQKPGIMAPARMAAARIGPRSRRSSRHAS